MPVPDPKKDLSKTSGETQKSVYPLDRYTVAPKSAENEGGEQSPFYKSSAPSISLPKGGGALKGIDEKFTVNAVNGTAALQVSLPLTPGRSGFTPSLSLQYNSGSGNSEFGLGWSLSLPAIQRKTDKKLPQYDDAHNSDVFIMAGAEDLQPLLIYNTTTSTWNADIQTGVSEGANLYTVKRYRPRIEGLFARIEFISQQGTTNSWWKVTTKENIVTFYGLTAAARVTDPQNPSRIFKWLPELSFDNKGNVMQYFYTTENTPALIPAALHERNRMNSLAHFTFVYLQRVKYCNLTPYIPSGHLYDYSSVLPSSTDFMMEAVFDYGNYDLAAPTPNPSSSLSLPTRIDPFSDFHAGFEIRAYRKCMRVLMFHYFIELNSGSPVLVRSLDMTYNSGSSTAYAEADFITSITQNGYVQLTGTTYTKRSLPALSMTYAPLQWNNSVSNISPQDAENAPQGLTGSYQWIDLYGEGLPGILSEQANGWFYKSNLGNGHFVPAVAVASKPSFQGLGNNMQWQDLDADGRRQLVSRDSAVPGYFELDDNQQWQPFRAFSEWVNVDWNSPYTRVLDLDGDGRPDVLITEDTVWKWYENAGTDGYTEGGYSTRAVDEETGPRMLLNDMIQVIFLADMNGDGLTDIVRIQNGEVCYWPNMGYGQFGARVTMTNSPWFDATDIFNPQYVTLADISGTGAADLIYIGKNNVTAWVNLAGNAWSAATVICPLPGIEQYSKITVTDFLGSGTSCIVWSSPLPQHAWAPMRYIDLMGGNKPYLMISYANNMGKNVALTYTHSTQFYLADKQAGTPWATRLPFPVHCVSQIVTQDIVTVSSVPYVQTSYTQQYSYHHGYYDHAEREFRGFGRVETIDTDAATAFDPSSASPPSPPSDNLNQAPVKTKTWYHTGAWMQEQTLLNAFSGEYTTTARELTQLNPVLLPATGVSVIPAQDQREAYRALKGQPLRQEVYALDGVSNSPYTVTTYTYAVQQVQPVSNNMYGSFLSYKQQTLTSSCERNVYDPRVLHELTLAVDIYGNVLNAAKVSYPRMGTPSPPVPSTTITTVQSQMLITYTLTDYTSDITSGAYRLRMPYQVRTYQLTGVTPLATLFGCSELLTDIGGATIIEYAATPGTGIFARLLSETRTLYLKDDGITILSPATIDTLGLPYQQYHLAFTNGIFTGATWYNNLVTGTMLGEGGYVAETSIPGYSGGTATNYWLPGGTISYDTGHFYMPTTYIDPWGNTTTVSYWNSVSPPGTPDYYLLPQSITDAVGNVTTVNSYNWYNLQPTQITDPNNNQSQVLYDALGMPVAAAMMEKNGSTLGDTVSGIDPNPNATTVSNFFNDPVTYAPAMLQGATWRCMYDLTVSPVAVCMIAREQHSLPAVSPPDTTLLMRLTYTDGLGRVAMHKVQTQPDESTPTIARWIGSGKTVYNNKGKVVMQYEPYYSPTPAYDPALQAAMLGVSPRMHYDPLGRVIRTDLPDGSFTQTTWDGWTQNIYDNNDTVKSSAWYTARTTGSLAGVPEEADAAAKAGYHDSTPTTIYLDTLARPFFTVQNNTYPAFGGTVWSPYAYDTFVTLDIEGDRLSVLDARGVNILTYSYNMLKMPVRQVSLDSGTQVMLNDAANQPLYTWDAMGNRFHHTYDHLRRQLTKEVLTPTSVTEVLEYMVYGEGMTSSDVANNLRTRLYRTYDGAGLQQINNYDFNGNPMATVRTFTSDPTQHANWNATNLASGTYLESAAYTTAVAYDALSRPVSITTPDGGVTMHTYELTGMLFTVRISGVHSLTANIINAIYYNPKGQRIKVKFQNGATTTYNYDPDTFRVKEIKTIRSSDSKVLQDLLYWYDPVGNITKQEDAALQSVYFNGTVAQPVNDYWYDALYRLIQAGGRELIGLNAAPNYNDSDKTGQVSPTNISAMQPYIQYYSYDQVGNMQVMKHTAGVGSFTNYWTRNFALEVPLNNRLHTCSIGSGTPPAGSTSETYTYDARGNMTGGMNHLTSMAYNEDNRLETVVITGTMTAYYQYDQAGQRVRKTIIDTGSSIKQVRKYVGQWEIYDSINTGTNTITLERETLHIMDDQARAALVDTPTVTSTGETQILRYQFSNHLSTATLELDSSAALISYEEYYPYGSTSYQGGASVAEVSLKRYRFTGKERDEYTGLYYHGARYYCPWLARWVAADPINNEYYNITHGQATRNHERHDVEFTASSYEYCYANPVRFTDPTGEQVHINIIRSLNSSQMVDALKIARNEVASRMKDHIPFELGKESSIKALSGPIAQYGKEHHLSGQQLKDFYKTAQSDYIGLASLATWSNKEFNQLNRAVINNEHISNYQKATISAGRMAEGYSSLWSFMGSATTAVDFTISMAGPPPVVGKGPIGPRINSSTQERIVLMSTKPITSSGIDIVSKHLRQYPDISNDIMLERLSKIAKGEMNASEVDVNFYRHELRESELENAGMPHHEAHEQTLKEQGMYENVEIYEKKLYTQEALDASKKAWENEIKRK